MGINFIGRAWSEPTLIKLASGFETQAKVRHAPKLLPTLAVKDFVPRAGAVPAGSAAKASGSVAAGRGQGRQRPPGF